MKYTADNTNNENFIIMKEFKIILFISLFVFESLKGQEWKINNDTLFTKSGVIIGDSTGSENSQLTIISKYNTYGGGGYGLLSKHSTNHSYLDFSARSRIGYTSLWSSQAQCAAIGGSLYLRKDNASSYDSHNGGGYFTCEFDNYAPYDMSDNIHFLGGTYSTIKGTILSYPNKSAISAIIGNDQIKTDKTYGGYFLGRGFFSDNLGIGTDSPKSKIEVADGDIFISDIEKGIIMKSPDGNCWRGTLDNSGILSFSLIDCPQEEITSQKVTKATNAIITYPNPTDNEIIIDLDKTRFKQIKYNIYRMDGLFVDSGLLDLNELKIDISMLKAGIYIIDLFDNNKNRINSQKIIKL